MTDNPNRWADAVEDARQQRLEGAVEELEAAEQAGLLGKPRDGLEPREAQTDAFETNQAALDAEYAKATDPDNQPPMIDPPMPDGPLISEADPLVPSWVPQATIEAADAYLATRTGVPNAVTTLFSAARNVSEAAEMEGPKAQAAAAVVGTALDAAVQQATPEGTVDPNIEEIRDTIGQHANLTIETHLGSDSADDQGPVSS